MITYKELKGVLMVKRSAKKILLISDFLSCGNIGGNLVRDVLSFYAYNVDFVPTALISNKFSISPIEISIQSDYLKNTLKVFKEQEKSYDAIFIGFIKKDQVDIIKDFVKDYKCPIFLDPIMGDKGSLYKSLDESIIKVYKDILDVADIILPNFTEASLLTDYKFDNPRSLLDYFSSFGKKLIITSVKEGNKFYIYAKEFDFIKVEFKYISHSFGGTGDLFDALFINFYLAGFSFIESIEKTRIMIEKILKKQMEIDPKTSDIDIGEIFKNI